jgi:hypothetical protein
MSNPHLERDAQAPPPVPKPGEAPAKAKAEELAADLAEEWNSPEAGAEQPAP